MNALAKIADTALAKPRRPRQPAWMKGTTREELIGLTRDGRKLLWSTGQIRPITTFPRTADGQVASAKYVLDWKGHRITAHCSQTFAPAGTVEVQIMCGGGGISHLPVHEVERFLRGIVVEDPVAQARLLAMMNNTLRLLESRHDTPSRQRGSIFDEAPAAPNRRTRRAQA